MKHWIVFVSVILVTLFCTLLYVRSRFMLIEYSYKVGDQRAERLRLEEERRALRVELTMLRDPRRIETIARSRLGLNRDEFSTRRIRVQADDRP